MWVLIGVGVLSIRYSFGREKVRGNRFLRDDREVVFFFYWIRDWFKVIYDFGEENIYRL